MVPSHAGGAQEVVSRDLDYRRPDGLNKYVERPAYPTCVPGEVVPVFPRT